MGIRTPGLRIANASLYQLSYIPTKAGVILVYFLCLVKKIFRIKDLRHLQRIYNLELDFRLPLPTILFKRSQ